MKTDRFRAILLEFGVAIGFALLAILVNSRMIRDGFNGLGDLLWHITWVQHFSHQLFEGIFYPRWLADTNFGYGSPTFVFYPPLPYYLGSLLKSLGLTIEQSLYFLFTFCIFLAGFSFYIYGRHRWGKLPGVVGGIYLITAPLVFHRAFFGALASALTSAMIPFGAYLTDRAVKNASWCIFLTLFWCLIALSHTPSLLLFFLTWLGYLVFLGFTNNWRAIVLPFLSAFLGFGIASAYLIPAILEQRWVNIAHMATSKSGWRANMIGGENLAWFPIDSIGQHNSNYATFFQLLTALVLTLTIVLIAVVSVGKARKTLKEMIGWLIFLAILLFLMSTWSELIWDNFTLLQKVQRPTRLMPLFTFGTAGLVAIAVKLAIQSRRFVRLTIATLLALMVLSGLRYSYKLSRMMPALHNMGNGEIGNIERLETALFDPYSSQLIDVTEYRPLLPDGNAPPPPEPDRARVEVIRGDADVDIQHWGSYVRRIQAEARESSILRIRTYYYPAWMLTANGRPEEVRRSMDGTMEVDVKPGTSEIVLEYGKTTAFKVGILLSATSIVIFIIFSSLEISGFRGLRIFDWGLTRE